MQSTDWNIRSIYLKKIQVMILVTLQILKYINFYDLIILILFNIKSNQQDQCPKRAYLLQVCIIKFLNNQNFGDLALSILFMNEIIEGQQRKVKDRSLSSSPISDSGSIKTGSLITSQGDELSQEPSQVSFRSPSPLQSRGKDLRILPTLPEDQLQIQRDQQRDSHSDCSAANTIPFSTHSGIHTDSEEDNDTFKQQSHNQRRQTQYSRRPPLSQNLTTKIQPQADPSSQATNIQKFEDEAPITQKEEHTFQKWETKNMRDQEEQVIVTASKEKEPKRKGTMSRLLGAFKRGNKKQNKSNSKSAPNLQVKIKTNRDQKEKVEDMTGMNKLNDAFAMAEERAHANTMVQRAITHQDIKSVSGQGLFTSERMLSGQSMSRQNIQNTAFRTDTTMLQEIKEELSSGLEPGSFHMKADIDFDVKEQNKAIQKLYRKEPNSPQQSARASLFDRKNSRKDSFKKSRSRSNSPSCKKKNCKIDCTLECKRKCEVRQLKMQQPIDLQQALKKIKGHLQHNHDEEIAMNEPKVEIKDYLQDHWIKYQNYKQQSQVQNKDVLWDWMSIVREIREDPIKCVKYNYALDSEIQNYLQYDSLISVSEDGTELIITNKKPVENPDYILDADPNIIKEQQNQFKRNVKKNKKEIKLRMTQVEKGDRKMSTTLQQSFKDYKLALPDKGDESSSSCFTTEQEDPEHDCDRKLTEIEEEIKRLRNQYKLKQSTSTCNLADIKGILFGGQSSRFWLYRKHFLCLDYQTLKNDSKKKPKDLRTKMPFYAWQCVTLQLTGRMVDLVIKQEEKMNLLLRLFIIATNTIDGVKDSASGLQRALFEAAVLKRSQEIKKEGPGVKFAKDPSSLLAATEKVQIRQKIKFEIYRQTYFKYKLMRIRIKIGFHAFQQRELIGEMIIKQILKSYQLLTASGSIKPVANYSQQLMSDFDNILVGDISQCMTRLIALNHDPVLFERKQLLYKQKELRSLGFNHVDQMPNAQLKQAFGRLLSANVSLLMKKPDSNQLQMKTLKTISDHNQGIRQQVTIKKSEGKWSVDNCDDHKKHNLDNLSKGFGLLDSSNCQDLFQNVKINGKPMYLTRNVGTQLRFKFNQRVLQEEMVKLRFILGVGGLNDIFFIKTILRKKEVIKKMFVVDLEQGQEVFIPEELTCDNYPSSFRYYDPIIQISNMLISKQSKIYHSFKTEFNLGKIKNADWQRDFLIKIGVIESNENKKVTHRYAVKNQKEHQEIQYTETPHPMSLQKSRYLLIDTTEESLKLLAKMQVNQSHQCDKFANCEVYKDLYKSIEDKPLNYRFCHIDEVNENQQLNITFKQAFYQTSTQLKNQGQKQYTMAKVTTFIEENIDELFEKRPRHPKEVLKLRQSYAIKNFAESTNVNEIELIPEEKRTQRQKAILFREKRIYGRKLLNEYEKQIKNRRIERRINLLNETNVACDKKVDYATKNDYLEERIEFTQKYFTYINDYSHKNQSMQEIRHQLFRINKKLKLKQKLKYQNADPMDVLKGFMMEADNQGNFALKRTRNIVFDNELKLNRLKEQEKQEIKQKLQQSKKLPAKLKNKNTSVTRASFGIAINSQK